MGEMGWGKKGGEEMIASFLLCCSKNFGMTM